MAQTQSSTSSSPNSRQSTRDSLAPELELGHDIVDYLKQYAREKPEVAALWCFGIGFILGWKLKPW